MLEDALREEAVEQSHFLRGVLVGMGLGLAGGLCAGLLMAPASGRRTRRRIARSAEQMRRRATHAVETAGERLGGLRSRS
jgi:gas vesicle protein